MTIQSNECHFCSQLLEKSKSHARCCKKKCAKAFCTKCIVNFINKNFTLGSVRPETWVCYTCAGTCPCLKCERKRNLFSKTNSNSTFKGSLRSRSRVVSEDSAINGDEKEARKVEQAEVQSEKSDTAFSNSTAEPNQAATPVKKGARVTKTIPQSTEETSKKSSGPLSLPSEKLETADAVTQNGTGQNEPAAIAVGLNETSSKTGELQRRSTRGKGDSIVLFKSEIIDNSTRKKRKEKKATEYESSEEGQSGYSKQDPRAVEFNAPNKEPSEMAVLRKSDTDSKENLQSAFNDCAEDKNLGKRKPDNSRISKFEIRYLTKKRLLKNSTVLRKCEELQIEPIKT